MTDFSKKLNDMLLTHVLSGKTNQQDMLAELGGLLDEIGTAGALSDQQLEQIKAQLGSLQTQQMQAAIASGNQDKIDAAIREQGESMGLDQEPRPEIFDALEDNDIPAIKSALEGWDVNARHGQFDKTALYAAVSNMFGVSLEVIDLLLDAEADPRKGLTQTGVLHGLGFGRYDAVDPNALAKRIQRCVTLGADIEERSENLQWTPLHTALTEWNEEASKALLLAGADPNARAGSDNGACTAGQSCLEMVTAQPVLFEMLLDHGADPLATNAQGKTVRDQIEAWLAETEDGDFDAELQANLATLNQRARPS